MDIMDLPLQHDQQQQQQSVELPKQIIWRRNAPYFYQVLYTSELDWPSLTVAWKPDPNLNSQRISDKQPQHLCFLAYGSITSSQQANKLYIGKVRIPNQNYLQKKYKQKPLSKSESVKKNDGVALSKIQAQSEISFPSQVNRIRYNPKQTNLLAARGTNGDIYIINTFKLRSDINLQPLKPFITLKGHQTEGYAMDWNPNPGKQLQFLSGSYDYRLSVWDVNQKTPDNINHPYCNFNFHQKQIQDVSFHHYIDSVFASCDDEGYSAFWDMKTSSKPIHKMRNHEGTIYSIQFSPLHEHLLATAGQDSIVKVWDIRNICQPLFKFKDQNGEVAQLKWSLDDKTTLWSVSDKMMTLWNICDQKPKFMHGGHLGKVNQMDIHPNLVDVFTSVDEDNSIHIFQPNRNFK